MNRIISSALSVSALILAVILPREEAVAQTTYELKGLREEAQAYGIFLKETGESQMSAEGRSYDVSRQLDEKIKNFDEAINRNDAAAVASLFTDDAIFVNYGGPLSGREAIEKQYVEWFKQWHHNNHLDIKDSDSLRIVGTADNIALNGKWSETDQQGEASVQLNGYWSAIYVRVGDTWKIRWLTYNVTPFPATATTAQK